MYGKNYYRTYIYLSHRVWSKKIRKKKKKSNLLKIWTHNEKEPKMQPLITLASFELRK